MSLHQISNGTVEHPQEPEDIQSRMLEILADRSTFDRQRRLASTATVVLNHGVSRLDVPLPTWLRRGRMGYCYSNAQKALFRSADRAPGVAYVEGYAYTPDTDVIYEHAWVEDADGNVLETTWPADEPRAYIGIPFELTDLVRAAADSEPLLFGDWYRDFRFLRSHVECCRPLPVGL